MPPPRTHRRAARRVSQMAAGLLPRLWRERTLFNRRSLPQLVEEAVRAHIYLESLDRSGVRTMISNIARDLVRASASQAGQPTPGAVEVPVALSDQPSTQTEVEICPVCLDRPVQVYLDCNHNFCGQCPAHWQSVMPQGSNNLTCPVCRAGSADIHPIRDHEIEQIVPITHDHIDLAGSATGTQVEWNFPNNPIPAFQAELLARHHRRAANWQTINATMKKCGYCGAEVSTQGLRTLRHERRCPGWD